MSERRSRSTACIAVLALTAFALALRLAGIDFYLPHGNLGDEAHYAGFLEWMVGKADPEDYLKAYPHFVPRLAQLLWREPRAALETLEDHVARAAAHVLLLRYVGACLSALIVPATYRIARRFLGRTASVLAAGLAGTSFLGLWFAPQARPHGAFGALCAIALLGALEVRRRGDLRAWLAAGVACAAAIGTLQNGVFLLGPLAVAHFLRRRHRISHLFALAGLGVVAIGVRSFYPFLFVDRGRKPVGSAALQEDDVLPIQPISASLTGNGFTRSLRAFWDYEPWLSACAALGIAVLCVSLIAGRARRARSVPTRIAWIGSSLATQRGGDLAVVAAFVLPFALVLGLYEYTHQRYLVPFVPILACCAAGGLEKACSFVAARWLLPSAAVLFALQATCALALARTRAAGDTVQRAAAWITAHVERGTARIAVLPGLELPLLRDEGGRSWIELFVGSNQNLWLSYQHRLAPDVRARLGWPIVTLPLRTAEDIARIETEPDRYFGAVAADYVVVYLPVRSPEFARIRAGVRARGELVGRFSPWRYDGDEDRPFLPNEWDDPNMIPGDWVWHALRAQCVGPVVEIYRFSPRAR